MTHEESVKIVKQQFINMGKVALIGGLSSWIPPLGVPPLKILTDMIATKAMTLLADSGEMGAFMLYINFNVDSQGRDFMKAAIENHQAQIGGTIEQKKITEENLKSAFRKLIRFTN
jgi:hypothetical protein